METKNSIPEMEVIQRKILEVLQDGKVHTKKELIETIKKECNITKEDADLKLDTGERIIDNRVGFAKSFLKNAGKIEYVGRGECRLVNGAQVAPASNPSTPAPVITISPEEKVQKACDEIKNDLKEQLLEKVRNMDPYKFEQLVVDLVAKMGYAYDKSSAWKTRDSNDEGIDGVVVQDALGFEKIYIQAKRYCKTNLVGEPALQSFNGSEAKGHKSVFITTSDFSVPALNFYNKHILNKEQMILINGEELVELMFKYNLGVYEYEKYAIKKMDNDYFDEL